MASSSERFETLMRAKTQRNLGNTEAIREAKKLVRQATTRIISESKYFSAKGFSTLGALDIDDDASSVASEVTSKSDHAERAVLRGSQMARHDSNEISDAIAEEASNVSDYDVTTITSAATETTSKASRKKTNKGNGWKKALGLSPRKKLEDDLGAWMCGVCGRTFASLATAEKHEDEHIREVVAGLGWAGEKKNLAFLVSPSTTKGIEQRGRAASSDSLLGNYELYGNAVKSFRGLIQEGYLEEEKTGEVMAADDRKPMSTSSLKLKKPAGRVAFETESRSEVRFDTDVQVVESLVGGVEEPDDYVSFADEALVSVCLRAEPMLLSRAERDAERSLALLAKDKAYYDLLADRYISRTYNPSNRFRSDGETQAGKVQNKIVDAYQLMKKGDQTKGVSDQYQHGSASGEGGSSHVSNARSGKGESHCLHGRLCLTLLSMS
jgi:rubrerythrin